MGRKIDRKTIQLAKDMEGKFNQAMIYAIVVLIIFLYASIAVIGILAKKDFFNSNWVHVGTYIVIGLVFGFVIYPMMKRILYPTKFN